MPAYLSWIDHVRENLPHILGFMGLMVSVYLLMGVARTIVHGVVGDSGEDEC
jgi:hypothetical protein